MKAPDDNLNIYVLPIGGGDSTIIQCPTGKLTVINLGTVYSSSYWDGNDIERFIGNLSKVETIVITRPHQSMYNLLPILFDRANSIKNVYIACSLERYTKNSHMRRWINKLNVLDKVKVVKSKRTGIPACLADDCTNIKLCSDSPYFESKILAANLAGCSENDQELRGDSIIMQARFYDFNMLMPGDFQDSSTDSNKFSKQIISNVTDRDDLNVTVYQAASHGAWGKANKYFFLNEIEPQFVVISNMVPQTDQTTEFTPSCELLYYLAHRKEGSILRLDTTQSFQCVWVDGTVSELDETKRAIFLTAFDNDGNKVRRVLQISSDGEKHKVSHIPVPIG